MNMQKLIKFTNLHKRFVLKLKNKTIKNFYTPNDIIIPSSQYPPRKTMPKRLTFSRANGIKGLSSIPTMRISLLMCRNLTRSTIVSPFNLFSLYF